MFRVNQPYLNLLVRPRIFVRFFGKSKILCILKAEMPFKTHKIMLFFQEKRNKCVPTSDLLPKTHIFFFFFFFLGGGGGGGLIKNLIMMMMISIVLPFNSIDKDM